MSTNAIYTRYNVASVEGVTTCDNLIDGGIAVSERWTWAPRSEHTQFLPENFVLGLLCHCDDEGNRRLLPDEGGLDELFKNAFLFGNAIRAFSQKWHPQDFTSGGIQFFASQWMRNRRIFLNRRFQYGQDLFVSPSGRIEDEETNILSPFRDLHEDLRSIRAIRKRSKLSARSSSMDQFFSGLYEIAKELNWPNFGDIKAEMLLKQSFFLVEELEEQNDDLLEEVNARLFRAFGRRQKQSISDFGKWLVAPDANLPRLLAKESRRHNESRLEHRAVKSALFKLGWWGMLQSAESLHATMAYLFRVTPEFTDSEARFHDDFYGRREEFAGFPFAILFDRQEILKPAFVDLWNGAESSEIEGAVFRMLYFYGVMARERRATENRIYRQRKRN